ncbi:MAG: PEGA domain-containing protein [Clostridium sp.]
MIRPPLRVSSVTYDNDHGYGAPVGAAVYVNGTYKGEVPCSFTKVIGNVTLSLTKDCYETKTYAVEISDDSKDISWSFPDLTKNS